MRNRKILSLAPAFLLLGTGVSGAGSTLPASAQPATSVPKPSYSDGENTFTVGPDGKVIKTPAEKVPDAPVFASFRSWMDKYKAATAQQKPALQAEGERLATERRQALVAQIPRDPKRALELSIGLHERPSLPTSVVQQLEEVLQGRAEYSVMSRTIAEVVPVVGKPGETKTVLHGNLQRSLAFGGRFYTAYAYGKREGLLTKTNLPFYGIAVENVVAIHESPIWVLATGQSVPAGATPSKNGTKCPVCGKDAANGIIGVVGSTIYYFDSQEDLAKFRQDLWAAEFVIGPKEHA